VSENLPVHRRDPNQLIAGAVFLTTKMVTRSQISSSELVDPIVALERSNVATCPRCLPVLPIREVTMTRGPRAPRGRGQGVVSPRGHRQGAVEA
jgi:hypothetical protein